MSSNLFFKLNETAPHRDKGVLPVSRSIFKFHLCLLLIGLSLISQQVIAEVYIHQLKHQPAEKLIPIIQPHLSQQTTLSASGFKLIVSGSKGDDAKVTRMLSDLDTPFKEYIVQLRITSVPIRQTNSESQTQIKGSSESSSTTAVVKRYRTDQLLADDNEFTVRLIENYQGYINTGETYPEVKIVSQYGHMIPTTARKKIQSGVYISVSPAGEQRVAVKASAYQQQRQSTDSRNTNTSSTASRILAKLDDWTLLASTENESDRSRNNRYSTKGSSKSARYYYVKVKELL